jgi:hypothetical protein
MSKRSVRKGISARLGVLAIVAACASGGNSAKTTTSPRTDLLTAAELKGGQWTNAYDAVRTLRARWLQARGPDTILGKPGEVQVHLDDVRLGGITSLREIPVVDIVYIQFFDPTSAAARWGLDHSHGAIYVSTRRP